VRSLSQNDGPVIRWGFLRTGRSIRASLLQDELCEDTSLIILPARVISDTLA
jgi:hypothetical protein